MQSQCTLYLWCHHLGTLCVESLPACTCFISSCVCSSVTYFCILYHVSSIHYSKVLSLFFSLSFISFMFTSVARHYSVLLWLIVFNLYWLVCILPTMFVVILYLQCVLHILLSGKFTSTFYLLHHCVVILLSVIITYHFCSFICVDNFLQNCLLLPLSKDFLF